MSLRRASRKYSYYWKRGKSRLGCAVPDNIRDDLVEQQYERIGALIPVLYFAIASIAIVAAAASGGGFDVMYHLVLPLGFIAMGTYRTIVWRRRKLTPVDLDKMRRYLRSTTLIAMVLGLVGGLWTLDAYYDTPEVRRVLAPVFIFMITFAGAICLTSLPRAAISLMAIALTPPIIAMILSPDPGIRAMGISLMIVTFLMAGLVITSFAQMIGSLKLGRKLKHLAESDALTGLANRRAFAAKFEALVEGNSMERGIVLTMIDLDGFKQANDQHGHQAGDAILVEVARRLQKICANPSCIARLGGDEFAILSASRGNLDFYDEQKEAIRKVISLPYQWEGKQVRISASLGQASYPEHGASLSELLKYSDIALYEEKALARAAG